MLGCHQLQREARRAGAARTLAGRGVGGQRRVPVAREPGADELDLPRLGREPAVRPRQAVIRERHLDPPVAPHGIEVDRREGGLEHAHVVVEQQRFGQTHRTGDAPEALAVVDRFAERLDRGLVPAHPEVAPRGRDVVGLDVGRGRQHDVGVLGGVGEELLVDDREQVVAGHAGAGLLGVRHDHERVAVPDDHRPYRRLLLEQDLAQPAHVERARRRARRADRDG